MRIIGLDPGLRATGWGVILAEGNRLSHVAHGTIRSNPDEDLAYRLRSLHDALTEILNEWQPQSAAVEETFVNKNPARSEEHTSELQSLMRISYAVFCLKKKITKKIRK